MFMKSNADKIMAIAKKILREKNIGFTKLDAPEFILKDDNQSNENLPDHWLVVYHYVVFEEEVAFIKINDEDEKLIHIVTKHGYINDEKQMATEDDFEDWDDV